MPYDTVLLSLLGLDSLAFFRTSSGPLTSLPYNNSNGENLVDSWGTAPPGRQTGHRVPAYPSPSCLPPLSLQHLLQSLIKPLNEAIGLGVVWAGSQGIHLQQVIYLSEQLGREIAALISQDLHNW